MSMFLKADELEELTGFARPADQRRWLTDRGWLFETNAAGRPVLLRDYVNRRLGGMAKRDTGYGDPSRSPNFAAVR